MVVEGIEIGLGLGGIGSRLAEEGENDAREASGSLAAQVAGVGHAHLGEGLAVFGIGKAIVLATAGDAQVGLTAFQRNLLRHVVDAAEPILHNKRITAISLST